MQVCRQMQVGRQIYVGRQMQLSWQSYVGRQRYVDRGRQVGLASIPIRRERVCWPPKQPPSDVFFLSLRPKRNRNVIQNNVARTQYYQMFSYKKWTQIFPKVAQTVAMAVFTAKRCSSKQPKTVAKYLGCFCRKICRQEFSKIAQSDHTARTRER